MNQDVESRPPPTSAAFLIECFAALTRTARGSTERHRPLECLAHQFAGATTHGRTRSAGPRARALTLAAAAAPLFSPRLNWMGCCSAPPWVAGHDESISWQLLPKLRNGSPVLGLEKVSKATNSGKPHSTTMREEPTDDT